MKRITLHRAAADNTGGFQDGGATLTIGDAAEPGVITAARAADLVDIGGAVVPDAPVAADPLELHDPIVDHYG